MIIRKTSALLTSAAFMGLMVFGAGSAAAADLPSTSLPPVEDVQYDEQVELGSGWYLRADVGAVIPHEPNITTDGSYSTIEYHDISMGKTAIGGVGFGYNFENGFRMDMTVDYIDSLRYDGKGDHVQTFANGSKYIYPTELETRRKSATVMLNAYYEFNNFGKFRPYIGGGVGMAWNDTYETTYNDPLIGNRQGGPGDYYFPNYQIRGRGVQGRHKDYTFAWALMTGVAFQLTKSIDLDVGYRYLNIGDVRSDGTIAIDMRETINGQPNPNYESKRIYQNYTRLEDLGQHEIRVGVRYKFDD